MASPAQVANDMAARAAFWGRRDRDVGLVCRDAARMINAYLAGTEPDGRTVQGVLTRLYRLAGEWPVVEHPDASAALDRAAATIQTLRQEACDAVR